MQLINTYQHYFRIRKLLRFAIFKTQHRIEHNRKSTICTEEYEDNKSESVDRRKDNTMVKRKRQKDKQRSTKHTHKTKDRVTRAPLQTGCSGMVGSSCSPYRKKQVKIVISKALS